MIYWKCPQCDRIYINKIIGFAFLLFALLVIFQATIGENITKFSFGGLLFVIGEMYLSKAYFDSKLTKIIDMLNEKEIQK